MVDETIFNPGVETPLAPPTTIDVQPTTLDSPQGSASAGAGLVDGTTFDPHVGLSDGSNYADAALPGELQEKYHYIGTVFANGAESTSYLSEDKESKSKVVIKVYHEGRKPNSTVLAKLQNMFCANKDSYTLYLPQIIDFSDNYEILEYLEGEQLGDVRKIDPAELVKLLSAPIDYLHKNHVIHRDIKPSNLIFNKNNNTLKIIDFGIARVEKGDDTSGDKEGTPPYQDAESYDAHLVRDFVDWWAVGIILLENQIGHIPLGAELKQAYLSPFEKQKIIVSLCRDFRAGVGSNPLTKEVELVSDLRFRRLVLGLLSPYGTRWKNAEIIRWLNGEYIALEFHNELLGDRVDDNLKYDSTYNGGFSVPGYDRTLVSVDDVYDFLSRNYPKFNKLFNDSNIKSRFKSWAKGFSSEKTRNLILAQIDSEERPEYRAMVIQKIIKPEASLYYRAVELSSKSIVEVLKKAQDKNKESIKWLVSVYNGGIFGSIEALTGGTGDGEWMKWQNEISATLTAADLFIEDLKISSFIEYYNQNKMEYLYVLFTSALDKNLINSIVKDTDEQYDFLELDYLKDLNYISVKRFREEYVSKNSPAKLFISIVVMPDLIRIVEEEKAEQGIIAEGIAVDENYRFRRRKSYYRQAEEGVPFFGPSTDEELDDRINKQANSKHDLFTMHKIVDYSSLVPSFNTEKPAIIKSDSPPIERYLVSDVEASALFGVALSPRIHKAEPVPDTTRLQSQEPFSISMPTLKTARPAKSGLFQQLTNFMKRLFGK